MLLRIVLLLAIWPQLALSQVGGAPLVVNIDNPNFRKLVMAVPTFVNDGKSSEVRDVSASASKRLASLLTYSGLFNIMSEAAYVDLMKAMSKQDDSVLKAPTKKGFEGIDQVQWKAIGVESLTIGEIEKDSDGFTLALRTVDINRGELLIGKRYSKVKAGDIELVMRRYADLILKAYTGRPGIFSSKITFIGRQSKSVDKQVYISDFDGSNVTQITKSKVPHISPTWSNDGKYITYTSYAEGNPDLYLYELATGKTRKLSGRKGLNSGSNWSPEGNWVAFTGSSSGDSNIYIIRPNGSDSRLLIKGAGLDVDPAFSPDGKWMAFVSGRYGNPHIFRASLKVESNGKVSVTGDKRLTYAGWYNASPAWSPDSDKIAFAGYDRDIDRFDLFMMNPDGSNLERLTIRVGDNENPSWSPNGQMLVFHTNRVGSKNIKGQAQLYVMNRDGGGQRKIDVGLYDAQTPDWSPQLD